MCSAIYLQLRNTTSINHDGLSTEASSWEYQEQVLGTKPLQCGGSAPVRLMLNAKHNTCRRGDLHEALVYTDVYSLGLMLMR